MTKKQWEKNEDNIIDSLDAEDFESPPEEDLEGESEEIDDIIAEEREANEQEAEERNPEDVEIKVKPRGPEYSVETCKVQYTDAELRELSDTMARKIGEADAKDSERKEVASRFKADIDSLQNEIGDLATRVRSRYHYSKVKCLVVRDFKAKKVTYTRLDTGEVHRDRPMTVDELQTELKIK
jgi:peptidoglycan hydrolase CwlO-like protein